MDGHWPKRKKKKEEIIQLLICSSMYKAGVQQAYFSEGAKSFFLIFFSRREMLFPGRKFPFR